MTSRIALVTGGGSGIGEGVARELAASGFRVAVCDVDADKGAAVAGELGGMFVAMDVTKAQAVEDGIAAVLLALVLGIVTYELTMRGLLGRSNLWTDELSRVILIAMVYFAAIGVTRDGAHVRVELLLDALPAGLRAVLEKLSDVLCLAFALSATCST